MEGEQWCPLPPIRFPIWTFGTALISNVTASLNSAASSIGVTGTRLKKVLKFIPEANVRPSISNHKRKPKRGRARIEEWHFSTTLHLKTSMYFSIAIWIKTILASIILLHTWLQWISKILGGKLVLFHLWRTCILAHCNIWYAPEFVRVAVVAFLAASIAASLILAMVAVLKSRLSNFPNVLPYFSNLMSITKPFVRDASRSTSVKTVRLISQARDIAWNRKILQHCSEHCKPAIHH